MNSYFRKVVVVMALLVALAATPLAAMAHIVSVSTPGITHTQVLHAGDTSIPAHGELFQTADLHVDGVINGQLQVGP